MSIRITELDAITSLQSGDYIAVDNESTGTHKFDALNIGANIGQNIANTYSSSASYAIGQYCLYDNNLYKCITTISTPEAWNSSHWIQVTVGEGLYEKVDKISGKGLSTNDFTDEYKQKLGGIEAGAEVNVQANWAETNTSSDDYIKNKPGNATTETSGFMSASDKQKLDNIASGAEVNVQANWAETDSSKDDYIKNKPTIDDALSTSSTNAVENSAIATAINNEATTRENADNALDGRIDTIEEILPNKANINGSYEEMTVGSAEQLISTESMEDSEPYIFRKSGNGADIGDRETDMLVGGTVGWNQLVNWDNITRTKYGVTGTISDNRLVFNGTATATDWTANFGGYVDINVSPVEGHKYYVCGLKKSSDDAYVRVGGKSDGVYPLAFADVWRFYVKEGVTYTNYTFEINIIDLTLAFGTEIADYIYSLEQANAGDGVAWFRKYFPKPYYAYNAGSLQSVNVASHDMTGFNQWDEEWELGAINTANGQNKNSSNQIRAKNYIPVFPNTQYYGSCSSMASLSSSMIGLAFYDESKNFIGLGDGNNAAFTTPNGCYYMRIWTAPAYGSTTYKNDICINISDANRNGEYEEYVMHSYPYDESVELRGVPQLVDGELKYDGDTYESSGKVTRKYGYVDLGTLAWAYTSSGNRFTSSGISSAIKHPASDSTLTNIVSVNLSVLSLNTLISSEADKLIAIGDSGAISVRYTASGTDAAAFKTAMSGAYLLYELATPTEETADPFTNPQIVDASGTEEYVDAGVKNGTRDVAIPVGHITQYIVNLRDKLQHLPFLAKEDGDYFVNQTGTQMSLKKVEGYYENLVVGVADNLSTDIRTNDQTPYLFRTSGGSVDIGDREYINSVVGGTIAWNQLGTMNVSPITVQGVTFTQGENGHITTSGTLSSTYASFLKNIQIISGHKYLMTSIVYNNPNSITFDIGSLNSAINAPLGTAKVFNATASSNQSFGLQHATSGTDFTGFEFAYMVIDLTQMFGSTIADYIYSLEQTNAGAGVSYFRKLFPKPYYAYNAGELLSVSGLQSHDMVGFNAFMGVSTTTPQYIGHYLIDDSGTKTANNSYNCFRVRVFPNTTYCMTKSSGTNLGTAANKRFVDGSENFISADVTGWNASKGVFTTPNNCYYVEFSVGASASYDICINLSWDGSRDGEYEPYQKWSYPLDSSLELRGIPKLDANNNLYYNGDTYESDGTVTRRYGVVDLGTLDWTYRSSYDGFWLSSSLPIVSKSYARSVNSKYETVDSSPFAEQKKDKTCTVGGTGFYSNMVLIRDTSYADATAFKTAMSGVYLVYELATPTTESAEPYTNPQIVDDFGTEEYVIDSTIDVPIPVGHNTDYPINLKSKLEMAPDSPDGDGDYIVRQTNGTNEYVPLIIEDQLPAVPSTDGTYTLTVTIANGEATYSWT